MKTYIFILSIYLLISCGMGSKSENSEKDKAENESAEQTNSDLGKLFKHSHAERILGERCHLEDSSITYENHVLSHHVTYKSDSEDPKSKKTGAIYIVIERYDSVSAANNRYDFIKKANESHVGVETLNNVGDEAYFHSDNENFYYIMIRKVQMILVMKVNKITGFTSLEEFNKVAREIEKEM